MKLREEVIGWLYTVSGLSEKSFPLGIKNVSLKELIVVFPLLLLAIDFAFKDTMLALAVIIPVMFIIFYDEKSMDEFQYVYHFLKFYVLSFLTPETPKREEGKKSITPRNFLKPEKKKPNEVLTPKANEGKKANEKPLIPKPKGRDSLTPNEEERKMPEKKKMNIIDYGFVVTGVLMMLLSFRKFLDVTEMKVFLGSLEGLGYVLIFAMGVGIVVGEIVFALGTKKVNLFL